MKTVKLNQLPFADGPHQYGVTSVTTVTTTHGRMTISFQFYSASIRLRDSLLSASGVGPMTARLQQHRKTKPMHAKWTDSVGKGKRLACSDRCRCVGPSITNATVDNAVARQGTNGMHTPSLLLVWSTKSYRKWLELTRSGQQSTGGERKRFNPRQRSTWDETRFCIRETRSNSFSNDTIPGNVVFPHTVTMLALSVGKRRVSCVDFSG